MQFVRIQEYPQDSYPALMVAACFENVAIPDRTVRTFNNVRVRTDYQNYNTGERLLSVFPSGWAEDESDIAYMRVGKSYYATIAASVKGVWSGAEIVVTHKIWGIQYDLRTHPLPLGDLIASVTLIGDRDMSIEPERFHLRIEADGTAKVRHLRR